MDAPNLDVYLQQRFDRELHRPAQVLALSNEEVLRLKPNISRMVAPSQAAPERTGIIKRQEAAKGDDTQKQQYLDQLLRDNPSPYVKALIYDPKGDRLDAHRKELIAKGLLDPSEIKETDELERMIDKILERRSSLFSPQEKEKVKQCIKQTLGGYGITKESVKKEIDEETIALVLVGPRAIGRNEKQYVFVKAGFFEGDEELDKIWISHEYIHAEHAYRGIRVGSFKIDYQTLEKQIIQGETLGVLGESLAWIDTVQRLRRSPKYWPKSEVYIEAVGTLFIYDSGLRAIKPKSDFEKKIIEYQSQQNKKYLPPAVVAEFMKRIQRIIEQEESTKLQELVEKALKCIGEYIPKKPLNLPPPIH